MPQRLDMPTDLDDVRTDFDRIARLETEPWEMDDRYIERLLARIPEGCGRALEIGCGTGRITRRLAKRCREVVALDACPEMIRVAAESSGAHTNIRYETVDFERFEAAPARSMSSCPSRHSTTYPSARASPACATGSPHAAHS